MTLKHQTIEEEAHTAFKLYKASRFTKKLLSDRQIILLKQYYGR